MAFRYYGGKIRHTEVIVPLLARTRRYLEPFCGSCAVLLAKRPSDMEIINDIDKRIVNFFRVLREHEKDLIEALRKTPYAREEFDRCNRFLQEHEAEDDPLEYARCFFVLVEQGIMARNEDAYFGRTLFEVRNGKNKNVNAFQNKVESLTWIASRLRDCLIENRDAIQLIEESDGSDLLIYADPPYPNWLRRDSGQYQYEQERDFHIRLLEALKDCKAKVALSSYRNDLYDSMLSDWTVETWEYDSGRIGVREEALYRNYGTQQENLLAFVPQETEAVA